MPFYQCFPVDGLCYCNYTLNDQYNQRSNRFHSWNRLYGNVCIKGSIYFAIFFDGASLHQKKLRRKAGLRPAPFNVKCGEDLINWGMSNEEENRIHWENIRQSNMDALLALHGNTYFHLIRFGLKQFADDELIKDCVNQLFLQLWDKRAKLQPVLQVRSYLFTALRHMILDELSYQDKMDNAISRMTGETASAELSYEEIIINVQHDEEIKQKLREAMRQLTPRQKELIQLKFFDGLSYEQIAEQTSQTVKTAYNTVYDAIKLLRKLLK
jgi:RNA polymerase sigma-70 factor (ECF subfamily)